MANESPLSDIRFLTVAEVATVMRISKMTVYRLIESGELEAIRVGRSFRIPEQAVSYYLVEPMAVGEAPVIQRFSARSSPRMVDRPGAAGMAGFRRTARRDELHVYIYIDTDDDEKIGKIEALTDELVDLLGFDGPLDSRSERGSWIRKSTARIKDGLTSSDVRVRIANLEQMAALYAVDDKQAQVDSKFADVLFRLIDSLKDVPSGCIRAGSTLLVKYEVNGRSIIQSRKLTASETRALEKYPEMQNDPVTLMGALALAVGRLEEESKVEST